MTAPRENAIGSRLGRYELKSRIAVGGMAEVWLAEASGISGFKKTVVLKTILPQYAHEPSFVRMLTNEAVLASGLSHANIVQIFDLGEIDGTYFIAMEYIAGLTLRQVQRMVAQQSARAPIWLVLHVMMSVCDALDYAHGFAAEGHPQMVHRDVSPENVMLSYAGVTKVLDFGIAKARSGHLTQPGTLQGKFAYMSPERIGSETQTDLRSDIYSIGVMLYELLVGRQPFQEVNELQLLGRILDHEPPAPREAAPWVPESLEKIVQKAMAKDPARRHQTAAELREDLSRFLVESRATTTSDRDVARFLSKLVATQKETERSHPPKVTPSKPVTGFDATRGPTADAVLPPDESQVSRNVPLATPAPSAMNVLRVLVVDADRVTRRFVELALTSDGFEVESAKTGSAALEILQSDPVDLIITDSDLPDMTGLRLHRRLSQQSRYRDIPVVFLSADTRAATKAVALNNGVEGVPGQALRSDRAGSAGQGAHLATSTAARRPCANNTGCWLATCRCSASPCWWACSRWSGTRARSPSTPTARWAS
jgi:serine/threonine protein kinase